MFVALTLIAINIYILIHTGTEQPKPKPTGKDEKVEWTVYGAMWCGWTKKQLKYLKYFDVLIILAEFTSPY